MKKGILTRFRSRDDRSSVREKSVGSELIVAIVAGIIAGIILLLVTPYVNRWIDKRDAAVELKKNLAAVNLGMSKGYIDDLFGSPLVAQTLSEEMFKKEEDIGEITSSAHRLDGCVLLCMYCDNNLAAFVVVVEEEDLYKIPANFYTAEEYLLDFTYADFSDDPRWIECIEGNVPMTSDHWAYYCELYYGANIASYNYFVVGSYKDFQEGLDVSRLMWIGQDICMGNYKTKLHGPYDFSLLPDGEEQEYLELRKKVKPNAFGVVDERFAEEFNFVFHIIGTWENASILF